LKADFVHEPGKMPMTTDWWVALQVEEEPEDRIAVEDNGAEWKPLLAERALNVTGALAWLASLPPSPGI
jgi:hypothetical protein